MQRRAFITGDSHTAVLRLGLAHLAAQGRVGAETTIEVAVLGNGARLLERFFRDDGTRATIIDPGYRKHVSALPRPGDDPREVAYGWSGLFHFARLWRRRTWARFRPSFHAGPGQPVSTQLLRTVVLDWFAPQLELLDVLRRVGAHVFVVESPRPFRHHPAFTWLPPDLAIALDRFCHALMQDELGHRGIGLVRIPAHCVDADGFMLPEWRSDREGDPHHGNPAFGALMMRETVKYLEARADD